MKVRKRVAAHPVRLLQVRGSHFLHLTSSEIEIHPRFNRNLAELIEIRHRFEAAECQLIRNKIRH